MVVEMTSYNNNNNNNNSKALRRRGCKDPHDKATSAAAPASASVQGGTGEGGQSLLIQLTEEDGPTWYKYGEQYPERNATIQTHPPLKNNTNHKNSNTSANTPATRNTCTPALVAKYRAQADDIYNRQLALAIQQQQKHGSSSSNKDDKWVETTMRKGTLKDRIAANSVLVSNDPIYKFHALNGLLQMAGCSTSATSTIGNNNNSSSSSSKSQTNSRVAQMAAEALEDLFLHTFLPPRRKLISLAQRPLYLYENNNNRHDEHDKKKKTNKSNTTTTRTQNTLSPRILLLWRFEEMVQEKYDIFLQHYLRDTLQEGVELRKIHAIRSASTLLRSVPQAEDSLLTMLVNKLGDPTKKVAAAAGHELRRVLQQHPVMLSVIAREVQQLAHRPHLSHRALYNCVIFLNQLQLKREDDDDDDDGGDTQKKKSSKSSSSRRRRHRESLPASLISTYFRLFEVAVAKKNNHNRTNNNNNNKDVSSTQVDGMKSRLLSALLTGVNRAHPYLPRHDQKMEQHMDALYRIVHTAPPAACTQALLLLFHLVVGSNVVGGGGGGGGNDGDDEIKRAAHQQSSNNASSSPEEDARKNRFYRALYATLSESAIISSGKHLTMYFNLLYKAMKYDTDTNRVAAFAKRIMATTIHASSAVVAASLFLLNEIGKTHPSLATCFTEIMEGVDATRYLDYTKRDPRGALVSKEQEIEGEKVQVESSHDQLCHAPGWEVTLVASHYHPSVKMFASSMGGTAENDIASYYSGDPLKDFALIPFLDKFAYRNPKSAERVAGKFKRGESIAERKSGTDSMVQKHFALPVNDPSFLSQQSVEPQDEFFRQFFVERSRRDEIKGIVRHKPKSNRVEAANETEREEIQALDEAEALGEVDDDFAKYEAQWENDSDEEAFVDSLSQKMIEDAIDVNGLADLDDEDPSMDDWGDLNDDEDERTGGYSGEGVEDSGNDIDYYESSEKHEQLDDDVDAFMDNDDDDESSLDEEGLAPMLQLDTETDHVQDEDENEVTSDDDMEGNLFLSDDESSVEDYNANSQKAKDRKFESSFAPAEEYEELVNQSWNELTKRRRQSSPNYVDNSDQEKGNKRTHAKKSKKKKRQKR